MEYVVLVDESNREIGMADKATVHTTDTPLHRAFSLFLLNSNREVLLTKRASSKKTFPGVWTNAVCGHPGPGESTTDAAVRRLWDELGIGGITVSEVAPYRYRFADKNGIVENEICPICIAVADVLPKPREGEVDAWKWMAWDDFLSDTGANAGIYSPWCIEEARILDRLNLFDR